MNVHVTAEFAKTVKEAKGLTAVKATYLKTKTKLEVQATNKEPLDASALETDIELLGLEGEPVSSLVVIVEGAQALGRVVNRSVVAFSKIGIGINEMGWEDEAGVITITGGLNGNELPMICDVMCKMVLRATKKMSHTHHALTLFDLKQTIGLTYDLSQGVEGAQGLKDWFDMRELVVLEEAKAAKAAEKAKAKEKAKVERHKAKAKAHHSKQLTRDLKGKAKNSPKKSKKGGKTAPLANVT